MPMIEARLVFHRWSRETKITVKTHAVVYVANHTWHITIQPACCSSASLGHYAEFLIRLPFDPCRPLY